MSVNGSDQQAKISEVLDLGQRSAGRRYLRWIATVLVVLLILASVAYTLMMPAAGPELRYESAEVTNGDLTVTVTATGTLQPVNQVDVGSELSGIIEEVTVDFNDRVQRGQVLARLDTDRLTAQVNEARASLESTKAKLVEAKATVLETRLRYERYEKLAARQLCSGEELDTARAAQARAKAVEASARA